MISAPRTSGAAPVAKARVPSLHLSVVSTAGNPAQEALVSDCLRSLFDTTRGAPFDLRVTLVNNAMGNELGAPISARFPTVQVIENTERRGFAANHNAALTGSDADYLLVANDDIVFLPGALERAVAYMEEPQHGRVGVIGFRLLNPDGSLQPSTYAFPTLARSLVGLWGVRRWVRPGGWAARVLERAGWGSGRSRFWAHDRTIPVDTFRGALVLVRGSAAREVGMMQEVSRLGGEEAEWFQRFRRGGWQVMFLHEAEVIHHGNSTVQGNPRYEPEQLKGIVSYFQRHRSAVVSVLFRSLGAATVGTRWLWYTLAGNALMAEVMRSSFLVLLGRAERVSAP